MAFSAAGGSGAIPAFAPTIRRYDRKAHNPPVSDLIDRLGYHPDAGTAFRRGWSLYSSTLRLLRGWNRNTPETGRGPQ
jgi:hypothetical protein